MNFSLFNNTNTTDSFEVPPRLLGVSLFLVCGVAFLTFICCLHELTRSTRSLANHSPQKKKLNEEHLLGTELNQSEQNRPA